MNGEWLTGQSVFTMWVLAKLISVLNVLQANEDLQGDGSIEIYDDLERI